MGQPIVRLPVLGASTVQLRVMSNDHRASAGSKLWKAGAVQITTTGAPRFTLSHENRPHMANTPCDL